MLNFGRDHDLRASTGRVAPTRQRCSTCPPHEGEPLLVFGFTFLVWQQLLEVFEGRLGPVRPCSCTAAAEGARRPPGRRRHLQAAFRPAGIAEIGAQLLRHGRAGGQRVPRGVRRAAPPSGVRRRDHPSDPDTWRAARGRGGGHPGGQRPVHQLPGPLPARPGTWARWFVAHRRPDQRPAWGKAFVVRGAPIPVELRGCVDGSAAVGPITRVGRSSPTVGGRGVNDPARRVATWRRRPTRAPFAARGNARLRRRLGRACRPRRRPEHPEVRALAFVVAPRRPFGSVQRVLRPQSPGGGRRPPRTVFHVHPATSTPSSCTPRLLAGLVGNRNVVRLPRARATWSTRWWLSPGRCWPRIGSPAGPGWRAWSATGHEAGSPRSVGRPPTCRCCGRRRHRGCPAGCPSACTQPSSPSPIASPRAAQHHGGRRRSTTRGSTARPTASSPRRTGSTRCLLVAPARGVAARPRPRRPSERFFARWPGPPACRLPAAALGRARKFVRRSGPRRGRASSTAVRRNDVFTLDLAEPAASAVRAPGGLFYE